ncbi:DUF4892 domain-containing protein [Pseudomonas sp. KSR10]|uniref:DUF4892 domain-containing protein n=1 Tax=unclassified Pseudomonas TaxID=196821 RepID=UPI001EF8CCC5|nr:DUF4892 domain-containing protein [Pseudomonas sp. KSR10]MCG6542551.1 DUF4892 domain-containing protein [Pseudomonas sp. KSR10]
MRSVWTVALAMLAHTASAADVPGSRDFDSLERYPQAQIVAFKEQQVLERTYPLDSIRRISGRLRMSDQVSASGQLTAATYQLPEVHTGIEAFERARNRLLQDGAELLFWCEGRECGSSSLWANDIFQRSTLYGPDARQAYLLARLPGDSDRLMALYGITRGNGRPYLQVEQFTPDEALGVILPNPATLLRQLKSNGELWLPRLPQEPTAEWGALLANVLRLDSTMRVALAGKGAEGWREALTQERIKARRLDVERTDEDGLRIKLLR